MTLALLDHQLGNPAAGWMEVGTVIIEPVQGNGGMIPTPPGFLAGLRSLCSDHGVLLIVDEVMSGFHRTGSRFAFELEEGCSPDIVVMGKSLSAGLPLSGLLVSADVAEASPPGTESSTYAGNLVSCAAALVAMDIYEDEDLSSRAAELGEYSLRLLKSDLGNHPNVGDIRGTGLMLAVELVEDRASRQPLPIARSLSDLATRRGLLVYPGGHHDNVIALLPPLVATERQLSAASSILRDLLNTI
jgi:4-aminobutyrate aminotransferase-like enzyme